MGRLLEACAAEWGFDHRQILERWTLSQLFDQVAAMNERKALEREEKKGLVELALRVLGIKAQTTRGQVSAREVGPKKSSDSDVFRFMRNFREN